MVATNFFAGAAVLLAAAGQVSAAGSAIINNQCPFKVYLWSISNSDSPMQTLKANGGQYTESYQVNPNGGGISIKMGSDKQRQDVTQFEYTLTGDSLWYDLSNINGFPFVKYGVTVVPSDSKCRSVSCPAGQALCGEAYNIPTDNFATAECGSVGDTVIVLCSNETDTSGGASISSIASAAASTATPVTVFTSAAATSTLAAETTEKASSRVISNSAVSKPAHKQTTTTPVPATTTAPSTTAAPANIQAAVDDNPYVVIQTTFVTHVVTVEARSPKPTPAAAAKRDVHHEHAAVHHDHVARRHSHPRAFPRK